MFRIVLFTATSTAALLAAQAGEAAYLNFENMTVSVGSGTGDGSSNNTFSGGQTIDKVIDAPSAEAEEFHTQTTHIWYTFSDPDDGLELIFDFDMNYDITTLHFWNYTSETYDVDQVDFSFFNEIGDMIGTATIFPELGSSPGIEAQDVPLVSPLNVSSVEALLTGTNGQVDFQNIGFSAVLSDPGTPPPTDPEGPTMPPVSEVPLPASSVLLLGALSGLGYMRRRRKA